MFKLLRNYRAQAIIGEYVLVFFVAIAAMTGVTILVRRALQGRIHDAQITMYQTVTGEVSNTFAVNGLILRTEYEPYYAYRNAVIVQEQDQSRRLYDSFNASSGIFRLDLDDETRVVANSIQLPPAFGN